MSAGTDSASRPWPSRWTSSPVPARGPSPRRRAAAAARAVSSTASAPQWKAAVTSDSAASVTSGVSSTVSTARRAPTPRPPAIRASGPASIRSHQAHSTSASPGRTASRASSRAQRAKDVPVFSGGRAPASPAASSGPSSRQDTPSTARWCTVSNSSPGCPEGTSSQVARSISPRSGSSRTDAASSSASSRGSAPTGTSTRSTATSGTASGISSSPSTSRIRSTPCRSASPRTAAPTRAGSTSPGTGNTIDCVNAAASPPCSRHQRMTGVSGKRPVPVSSPAPAPVP